MEINRASIKANARFTMSGTKPNPLLVALVFVIIVYILNVLSQSLTGQTTSLQQFYDLVNGDWTYYYDFGSYYGEDYFRDIFNSYAAIYDSAYQFILDYSITIILHVLSAGFMLYALNVSRSLPSGIGNIFDGFALFIRIIALYFIQGVFIFLWSLLLVIPGIVASYRYRQAIYLLFDNPQWTALECIRVSKEMMIGRKGELFVLDLSFIGWRMLEMIPFVKVWTLPYTEVTYANYYNALLMLPEANPDMGYRGY